MKSFFQLKFTTLYIGPEAGHSMEWNRKWNRMERKFRYGIWKMPQWNGRFQEWNGRQSFILLYQFHTRFRSFHIQKNEYR